MKVSALATLAVLASTPAVLGGPIAYALCQTGARTIL